ncbi:MAG: glycosyltransferase family 4 protein [Clostridia bacterium]|nr:glycosyltransferase family 4 protein [Clostridia bacterium]
MITVYQVVSDTNIGGAGRYLLNYVKHFDRTKFKVTVLIPERSKLKPFLEMFSDVTIKEIPYMADKSYDKRCVQVLYKLFKSEHIDVLHTHASLSARIAARKAKVGTIVATRHCIEGKGRFPVSVIKRICNNLLCDIYVAVSDAVAENLLDCGINKKKIRAIPNGVAPIQELSAEEKQSLRSKFGIGDEMVFGIFARLEAVKGHQYFIEAVRQFLKQGGKGKFLIVGDGSLAETLKQQAADIPEIIFTGYVADTTPLLNITDVNVIASQSEAMSLAILEAMSLKKPTIATRVGGNPQLIIPMENGLLTEYADSADMANAFYLLSQNRALYETCASNAGACYNRLYTAETMVNNIERLYEEVAE